MAKIQRKMAGGSHISRKKMTKVAPIQHFCKVNVIGGSWFVGGGSAITDCVVQMFVCSSKFSVK